LVVEHWPQAPDGSHAGAEADIVHSPSPAHPRHVCVAVLHTGTEPPHVAFETHATQTPTEVSHAGVAPPQREVFVAEH
jgi:hypothetical protein